PIESVRPLLVANETPFYLYHSKSLREAFQSLQAAVTTRVEILYSVKANPNRDVLSCFESLGALADVASAGEYHKGLAAGFTPELSCLGGRAKTLEELDVLAKAPPLSIVVESEQELQILGEKSLLYGVDLPICLRVNPSRFVYISGRDIKNAP